MPILKNAKKALRVSQRKTEYNQRVKSRLRTMTKAVKTNPTPDNLKNLFSAVDKALKKNLLHRNKAARIKSQMSKLVSTK